MKRELRLRSRKYLMNNHLIDIDESYLICNHQLEAHLKDRNKTSLFSQKMTLMLNQNIEQLNICENHEVLDIYESVFFVFVLIPYNEKGNKNLDEYQCMEFALTGTCFAISPHRVLTCRHCIHDENTDKVARNIYLTTNIVKINGKLYPSFESPLMHAYCIVNNCRFDYAILHVDGTCHHQHYYGFTVEDLKVCPFHNPTPLIPLPIWRYAPSEKVCCYYAAVDYYNESTSNSFQIWQQSESKVINYYNNRLRIEDGLCGGSSGAPVINSEGYVVAMHVESFYKTCHRKQASEVQ